MTDPMELVERLDALIVGSDDTDQLLDGLTKAAACIRDLVAGEKEVTFETWQGDNLVAASSHESDAAHYAAVYSQDGPVKLVRAITYRTNLVSSKADRGGA